MMSIRLGSLVAVCLVWLTPAAAEQPRLAVVVVVDQMRASYLDEFADDYDGGFARLRDEGALFTDAFHDHALTETAPGHATIVTGVYPSHHGIVSNAIWNYEARALRTIVLDTDTAMVGAVRRSGRSPHRLMRSALGDWLKASSPQSKVFGVSLKDRAAVFSAGQRPDGAYWYDEREGNFVTSAYYVDALPSWVVEFNEAARVDRYFGRAWIPSFPAGHDRLDHESAVHASYSDFPHVLIGNGDAPDRRFYAQFRRTPFADRLTLAFAEALIGAEGLGEDASVDLLVIGLSATDYIGHRYGPWSEELHDHYERLDGYLGEFVAYLDDRLGPDAYVLTLTADHGVLPVPDQMAAHGIAAGRMQSDDLLAEIVPIVSQAVELGIVPSMPSLGYASGVVFDFGGEMVSSAQTDALAQYVADHLINHPFIAAVFTGQSLRDGDAGGVPWFARFQRSYFPGRSPAIMLRVKPNYVITDSSSRATHGSPYDYDARVPLIFFGAGVGPGVHTEPVPTVDIAPTLAAMLGLVPPVDLDGRDISEKIRSRE